MPRVIVAHHLQMRELLDTWLARSFWMDGAPLSQAVLPYSEIHPPTLRARPVSILRVVGGWLEPSLHSYPASHSLLTPLAPLPGCDILRSSEGRYSFYHLFSPLRPWQLANPVSPLLDV